MARTVVLPDNAQLVSVEFDSSAVRANWHAGYWDLAAQEYVSIHEPTDVDGAARFSATAVATSVSVMWNVRLLGAGEKIDYQFRIRIYADGVELDRPPKVSGALKPGESKQHNGVIVVKRGGP